jgi:hypothetical protein
MLTFFRRIRKGLLDMGDARKYLLYALGEIALVVIGILIALQINNWNEESKKQESIKVYLMNLIEDLENDIEELEQAQSYNNFRYHSLQNLLTLSGIEPLSLPEDFTVLPFSENQLWSRPLPKNPDKEFLNLALNFSVRWTIPKADKSTINELNSTGTLSYLKNQNLKDAVSSYYDEWTWSLEEIDFKASIRRWEESLRSEGIVSYDITALEDPIKFIQGNQYGVLYLKDIIGDASWIVDRTIFLMEKSKELIAVLEEEIST